MKRRDAEYLERRGHGECKGTSSRRAVMHILCTLEKQIVRPTDPAAPSALNSYAMTSQVPGIWAHGWQVPLITLSSAVDITIT